MNASLTCTASSFRMMWTERSYVARACRDCRSSSLLQSLPKTMPKLRYTLPHTNLTSPHHLPPSLRSRCETTSSKSASMSVQLKRFSCSVLHILVWRKACQTWLRVSWLECVFEFHTQTNTMHTHARNACALSCDTIILFGEQKCFLICVSALDFLETASFS